MKHATTQTCPSPRDLCTAWRERAATLRSWAGADGPARAYELAAQELEASLSAQADRLLGVVEASALFDRHRDTIGNAIRDGRLTNFGTRHRPQLKFGELARVFPAVVSGTAATYDTATDARSRLSTRRGDSTQ